MSSLQHVLQAAVGPAYEIGRELPGAGMSRVFLAREPALARDVVVKVLPPDLVSTTSLQLFTREVQVTARLQHPHILPVITAGGNDELRFYITPFIQGESLRTRLASGEPMSFAESVRIGDELLTAIAFAHRRGVIHRDVKPGNILLSEGHPILADFGIASIVEAEHAPDHHEQVAGSSLDSGRVYTAPEQPRDERRDLFAAAVVIHEMVVGIPAAAGVSATGVISAIRARHPQAPASDVRKLAAILSRALSVDPSARYQSATDLRGAIHAIGRGSRRQLLIGIGVGGAAAMLALSTFALRPSASTGPVPVDGDRPVAITLAADGPAPAVTVLPDTLPAASPPALPMSAVDTAAFALRRGDLGGAITLYGSAASADPGSSRAQLGLAVTSGLIPTPADQEAARIAATRALEGKPALGAHDRAVAEGFIALADRRYPEACAAFERARATKASFEAWMGLGECRLRDDAIVIDNAGRPAFRSSYVAAFSAFASAARAAAPTPPAIVYRRLIQTVPQSSAEIRVGRTPDNRSFVGNWRIVGDTLGFALSQSGAPRQLPPETFAAAAEAAKRGREQLRPLLIAWTRQAPEDPSAHELLALLLEHSGNVAAPGDDRVSALTAIGRARARERDPVNSFRLAAMHARLLLRAREYDALADLADSLLAAHGPESQHAEALLPLAMLTGRADRAAAYLARAGGTTGRQIRGADGRPVELPPDVISERADFLVRATMGICDARVKSAPARLLHLLDATFPAGVPRGVESGFMDRIVMFALPCLGPSVVKTMREPGRTLVNWARAFDPEDTGFPAEYATMLRNRPPMPAGSEQSVDGVMVDALVKLAVKDSAEALTTLTLALDRIPMMGRGLLASEWTVGSIPRGMAMAAEIAAARGDRETAGRWALALATLWRNADPVLQPQVERARAIAQATSVAPPTE